MKNVIIGPAYPLRGGIANFNEALCKSFAEAGSTSQIISFTLQYPSFLFPGKTQYDTSGKAPAGIIISPMINSVNPLNWIKVARFIKKQKPDYVIVRYWLPFMAPCLGTIAKWIKKNTHIKVIAVCDNVIPHEQRPGDLALTRYFIKQCDGFVVMSESVQDDLMQIGKGVLPAYSEERIKYLPHPVYDIFGAKIPKQNARNHLRLTQDAKYLLFFGFIRKYKGLDLLLEALADERIKKMNIKLVVAGEYYEDKAYYEELIYKNNLKDNVLLKTEFIPSDEVKYYFCAADIVVQPYRSATQSGVTQIAYHFERPMLVTDVGGLSEIVPHNKVGYVIKLNEETPKTIAEAILDFYQNQREEEFTRATALEKHRFTWKTFVQGIEELVKELPS